MAKTEEKRLVKVQATSVGLFVGTFWAILGLGVAILNTLKTTVNFTKETESILGGLAFGTVTGFAAVIILPLAYFGIGWLLGALYGWIFNLVAEQSGGIVVSLEDKKK